MGKWGGSQSRNARAQCVPLLGQPCPRCGFPVVPDPSQPADGWHPDHWPIPREHGGTRVVPAHARCNTAAGGRRGAQLTNARRRADKATDNRPLNMRGI